MVRLPQALRLPWVSLFILSSAGCAGTQSTQADSAGDIAREAASLDRSELPSEAGQQVQSAIELMDAGNPQGALPIWEELNAKYPHHYAVVFELALTYRMLGRPLDAAETLEPYDSQLDAQGLASLASAYDDAGQTERALKVVDSALKSHPDSGILYSTRGTCLANSNQIDRALASYTKGIEVDPTWPSNYFQRSLRLANSDASAVSLIDGETFRNLEPSTARSEKIALLMMDILKQRVTREVDAKGKESVSIRLVSGDLTGGDPLHPLQVFELALGLPLAVSVLPEKMTLPQLVEARNQFVSVWSEQTADTPDAPALAKYLSAIQAAGHKTAYHYWLFAPVDPEAADAWIAKNRSQFDAFAAYVQKRPIQDELTAQDP